MAVDQREGCNEWQFSSLRHVDRLHCPVIFFQGTEDEIVPPNQAEAMREALLAEGIDVEYLLFEGEWYDYRNRYTLGRSEHRAPTSLYPDACRMLGIDFGELTERLAKSALQRGPDARGDPRV